MPHYSFFALVLGIGVAESILSGTWNRWYFRFGIPIFRYERSSSSFAQRVPAADSLSVPLEKSIFPAMEFRPLDEDRYAFRERAWPPAFRFGYTPVMRGIVWFDSGSSRVVVSGKANWFPLAFAYFWFSSVGSNLGFALFFLVLVAVIYAIQARRFREVGAVAARAWSTTTVSAEAEGEQ